MRFRSPGTFSLLLLIVTLALAGCLGTGTGSLNGVVKWESGEVIANAAVQVGDKEASTDASGQYSFSDIRAGTYTLTVLQGTRLLAQERVQIKAGENVHDVTVSKNRGSIQGTLVNRAGRPIAGATVSIGVAEATTDANGAFLLDDLPAGSFNLTVTKGGQQLADAVTVNVDGSNVALEPIVGQRIVSLGKSYKYQVKGPHSAYPDEGLKEMTDGVTGTNSYANPAWTAVWYNDTFHIDFDLEEHTNVYQVRVHMLAGTAGIFYPSKLSVSVSDDGTTWTEVKELTNTEQPAEASVRWFEIDGIDAAGRYVRLSITYDPTVRDGEGTNMFLSEVEIYE